MTDDPMLQNGTAAYSAPVTNPRYGRPAAPEPPEPSTTRNSRPVLPQRAFRTDDAHQQQP